MTSNTQPRMDVVKREHKEAKLTAFITTHLAQHADRDRSEPWLLVAQSLESPVVRAIAALVPQISAAGIRIKALIAKVPPVAPDCAAPASIGFECELRVATDVRLLDAHEQLRLGATTAWVGDCMRREPAKRDAYECYAEGCAVTAAWSAKAFERLWQRAEAALPSTAPVHAAAPAELAAEACPPQGSQIPDTVVASTRH